MSKKSKKKKWLITTITSQGAYPYLDYLAGEPVPPNDSDYELIISGKNTAIYRPKKELREHLPACGRPMWVDGVPD